MIKNRSGIRCSYFDQIAENRDQIFTDGSDFVICNLNASDSEDISWLISQEFYYLDLRLKVRVMMEHLPERSGRRRFVIKAGTVWETPELYELYHSVFTTDRRFHLRKNYDQNLANRIIDSYIDDAKNSHMPLLSCCFKDQIIGAAILEQCEDGYFIYMAGVLPQYQISGAAVELYRACADFCRDQHGKVLSGWISAANTGVMNLYANLNGNFYEPQVLMVKEDGNSSNTQ